MVDEWRQLKADLAPDELITRVLNDTGYLAYLDDRTPDGESRIENVLELRGEAEKYDGLPLSTFLEDVSLKSDVDTQDDDENRPSLLTLHSAKGLEFPVVFITGAEENILPHTRSIVAERKPDATLDEKAEARRAVEEERRLMYVGITRARDRLYLVFASFRSLYGDSRSNLPSRFLYDIPDAVRAGAPLPRRGSQEIAQRSYNAMTTWGKPVSDLIGDKGKSGNRQGGNRRRGSRKESERPVRANAATRFKGGDVVWHAKYGEGVVVSSTHSGGMEQVDVLFPGDVGQKTIIADYLQPIPD